jgi:sulfate adenylyltransferase subunit 1
LTSKIKTIDFYKEQLEVAFAPQSVILTLEDDIGISRGDMIVGEHKAPEKSQNIDIMICWLSTDPLVLNGKYSVKHTSTDVRCVIKDVKYKVDINTLDKNYDDKNIGLNEIARVSLRTTKPLFYDPYNTNRNTGSLILIDESTNVNVGAGMIVE